MNFISRVTNFMYRSQWLGTIVGNPFLAAFCWVRARFSSKFEMKGVFSDFSFKFRGVDLPIVREVIHEKEYDNILQKLVTIEDPVILDVGAHIGLFAINALGLYPSAKIVSVEASKSTYAILKQNRDGINNPNWNVINRAGWSSCDDISFDSSSSSMSNKVSELGQEKVQGIALSDLIALAGVSQIDVLKVDIEGAEEKFLCECGDDLQRVKSVVVELHTECCDTERVKGVLIENFKTVKYLKGRNSSRPVLYAC